MNRRQSFRILLGTLFATATASKSSLAQPTQTSVASSEPANPKLVPKLTRLLEQAKRGELTSFAAVTFTRDGAASHLAEFARSRDLNRTAHELETLAGEMRKFATEVKAHGKD